jgi:molybdenum cofactor cytidylyltransferase
MGRDKALLTYRGRTFLESIITTLREAGIERVAVVLGHHAAEIQRAVDLRDVEVTINHDYRLGQTSSLQAGVRALSAPDLDAFVLCLVDHPAIPPRVVRLLTQRFCEGAAPLVIPTLQGQRGHPVLIARELFDDLLALSATEGANTVLRKYRSAAQLVEVQEAGILLDIDDAEAYRRLEGQPAPTKIKRGI